MDINKNKNKESLVEFIKNLYANKEGVSSVENISEIIDTLGDGNKVNKKTGSAENNSNIKNFVSDENVIQIILIMLRKNMEMLVSIDNKINNLDNHIKELNNKNDENGETLKNLEWINQRSVDIMTKKLKD